MSVLKAGHPALKGRGRTIFMKSIKGVDETSTIIKPGYTNTKLTKGKKYITKGAWKGMPMYQLILEERKTCPTTCQQWSNCYGNNMYLAHRIDHADPKFFGALSTEVAALAKKHPGGFVVRLHVLGDFFSVRYVKAWQKLSARHTELKLFGYTHRDPSSQIGQEIKRLNKQGAWIRWSDRGGHMSANVGSLASAKAVQCPEEVGKTSSCLTCALCWSNVSEIKFLPH
jgi:hypothetical protein